jgi:hypothetical protein
MLNTQELGELNKIAPFRNQRLFSEFLPKGYEMTTLDTVENRNEIIELKIILGTLITLYDDFADRPDRLNPKLLQLLYQIPFENISLPEEFFNIEEKLAFNLAKLLFEKLFTGMKKLQNFHLLFDIFCFDLKQFFLANHYSQLLTQHHHLSNKRENQLYLHHNMGIVMAGMIDLMNVSKFHQSDLGRARSLFLMGQRAGRISNVLTTYEREIKENDRTNELFVSENTSNLQIEHASLIEEMSHYKYIKSFSCTQYWKGILALNELHSKLKDVI